MNEEKRYSVLSAFIYSFFSVEFYRDVLKNWGFKAILFCFLASMVSMAPTVFSLRSSLIEREPVYRAFFEQFPDIEIKNKKILILGEQRPYFIRDLLSEAGEQEEIGVVDTSLGIEQAKELARTKMKSEERDFYFVLTSEGYVSVDKDGKEEVELLSEKEEVSDVTLEKEKVFNFVDSYKAGIGTLVLALILFMGGFFVFFYFIFISLLVALFVYIFWGQRTGISWGSLISVFLVSTFPANMLLIIAKKGFLLTLPFGFGFLFLIVASSYFPLLAIKSLKKGA